MSPFHLIAAVTATVPLWLFSLHEAFPWYYLVSIVAGELLLLFAAGFASALLIPPITAIAFAVRGIWRLFARRREPARNKVGMWPGLCPNCGATLFFAGRHFDRRGSQNPHWMDILIFIIFIALNVTVWLYLMSGGPI